jgi:alpha-glucosidase
VIEYPQHARSTVPWWRHAAMYEIYLRSFADGNGDGIGDLPGLRSRLRYLRDLGVDGIWITPWYPSPMKDGGYDVSNYVDIEPLFGTLSDARNLVEDAHYIGLKVIVDFVANHTSDEHPWFQHALAAGHGSSERDRYHFRDGKGPDGSEPPNDWISAFGGSAWTRVTEPNGTPGQWYLHLFSPWQPDLNWDNGDVRKDFESIVRFWFDFGLDGLRVDAASGFAKDPGLPDFGFVAEDIFQPVKWTGSPLWDVEGVHEILRSWRSIADSYDGDRIFVGEVVVNGPQRLARYMRPDELHTTFNLDFLKSPLDTAQLRHTIDSTLAAFGEVDAPATWTLSNHDETRHVTRYGRAFTGVPVPPPYPFPSSDRMLGTRRARAMLLFMLALPGSVYLYQGEELGLWEIEDLTDANIHDPVWESSGHTIRGRDGCRIPLPWLGMHAPFGFTRPGRKPWLPQPAEWREFTAETQAVRSDSMLSFYRRALALRRRVLTENDVPLTWVPAADGVLAFDRDARLRCTINLSPDPCPISGTVLIASDTVAGGRLAADTAAWTRQSAG